MALAGLLASEHDQMVSRLDECVCHLILKDLPMGISRPSAGPNWEFPSLNLWTLQYRGLRKKRPTTKNIMIKLFLMEALHCHSDPYPHKVQCWGYRATDDHRPPHLNIGSCGGRGHESWYVCAWSISLDMRSGLFHDLLLTCCKIVRTTSPKEPNVIT